jgi:hypothetical protein
VDALLGRPLLLPHVRGEMLEDFAAYGGPPTNRTDINGAASPSRSLCDARVPYCQAI